MNQHPPSARRMRVAANIAAREAESLTDYNLATFLRAWTPIFLDGLPLDRDPDSDPTDPGNE